MKRRKFLKCLAGAASAPAFPAKAQSPNRMRRIGVLVLYPEDDREGQLRATAFRQGLQTWLD